MTGVALENRFQTVVDGAFAGLESNPENQPLDIILHLFQHQTNSTNILCHLSEQEHTRILQTFKTALRKCELKSLFETIQNVAATYRQASDYEALQSTSQLPRTRSRFNRKSNLGPRRENKIREESNNGADKPLFQTVFTPNTNEVDRWNFYTLLLACADCAHKMKPWATVFQLTKWVMSELYSQSDVERKALGLEPLSTLMKDAERDIPLMEVKFIDTVVAPSLELFKIILLKSGLELELEDVSQMFYALLENRRRWEEKYSTDREMDDDASLDSLVAKEVA